MNHAKAIGQRNGRWAGGVGMAVGAAFAAALIGLANAPVAGAEGGALDTAVDNFLQGIANVFAPEVEGEALGDPDTFCGTLLSCLPEPPGEQMIDAFNLSVNTAFQPEGPIDNFFDQLLGGSAADPAQALDMQVSIFGLDLFPTAGNTATATSNLGDIAIAIGNGANAQALGFFDSAFASGNGASALANSFFDSAFASGTDAQTTAGAAQLFSGFFDTAFALGNDNSAAALGDFDLAAVFSDMMAATAIGNFMVDIVP